MKRQNMKKILIILLICINAPVFCQARLGSHIDSIKAEFSQYRTMVKEVQGKTSLFVKIPDLTLVYGFDEFSRCDITCIMPDRNDMVSAFTEKYSNIYDSLSPNKWKAHGEKADFDIELIPSTDKSRSYFKWTWSKKE